MRFSGHVQKASLRIGDALILEPTTGYIIERCIAEEDAFFAEEIPDTEFEQIGGLAEQIQKIRDAVELPYLHTDVFERFHLRPPNGILLFGPPGCGKTMVAKAIANSLAKQMTVRTGKGGGGHFLSIKVQKMVDKYYGETEKRIAFVFRRAKDLAASRMPVIIFLDEMDSLFRIRRSGHRLELEDTAVPQLLSEIDNVRELSNVIVIGASNRSDLIDPSLLRPGRMDLKIRIDRPDAEAAVEILTKLFTGDIPILRGDLLAHGGDARMTTIEMIQNTAQFLYSTCEKTSLFEFTFSNGEKEILHFRDFGSGAALSDLVDRAKSDASRRYLESRAWGIGSEDLLRAAEATIAHIREFGTEIAPDDLARLAGRKGCAIASIRTLAGPDDRFASREVDLERRRSD